MPVEAVPVPWRVVVPRFGEQIQQGGPITLTHPDINRFFMTIPETSQLVIQAEAMAQGECMFVLDMGQSVMIYDLAKRMVELSGLSLWSDQNPEGYIGLTDPWLINTFSFLN